MPRRKTKLEKFLGKNSSLGITFFFLVLTAIMVFLSIKQQTDSTKQTEQLSTQISNKVAQDLEKKIQISKPQSKFSDYDSLATLKKLSLAKNFESWSPNSQIHPNMIYKTVILDKGELARGYLYIKASLDENSVINKSITPIPENRSLTTWESIYLTLNGTGGHLYRPQSLPLPNNNNKTELLYALNNIPYLQDIPYNERSTPFTADWFSLFSDGSSIQVISFISSLRKAHLEEVTIYYQCVKDSDCLLKTQ